MEHIETWNAERTRVVITTKQGEETPYESRLYVSKGEVATVTTKKHKTIAGATKWALDQV